MDAKVPSSAIPEAVQILQHGGLVAFPTETVYGLGADARNAAAVRKIFAAKGRPASNPLIVHIASFSQIASCAEIGRSFSPKLVGDRLNKLSALWPGPLSVVLPAHPSIAQEVCAGGSTVAVRIPRHPVALELLQAFGGPVAAPSANPSNYVSPTTASHVREGLGSSVGLILDGGPCHVGLESTVLSLLEQTPRVLRPGAVTRAELSLVLGCEIAGPSPGDAPSGAPLLSPGLLEKHYSPRTPVVLLPALSGASALPQQRIGTILFSPRRLPFAPTALKILSPSGDLAAVAAQLFAALRELDDGSLDLIVADTCEPAGLGEAIMDRLLRASRR